MANMIDLPDELLILMLSNLFGKDRQSFLEVCKACNKAALFSPYGASPCLISYKSSTRLWNFYQYHGFFAKQLIPQIHNALTLCSKYGWLLMSHDCFSLFLFHPFKEERIEVPHSIIESYDNFSFFNSPTSSDCFIVCFMRTQTCSHHGVKLGVLELGGEWKEYESKCKKPFVPSSCTPILHHGLLHFLDVKGNVGTFEIEKGRWTSYKDCLCSTRLRRKLKQHFLFKQEETIFAIFFACDAKRVGVYRLLEPDMKWQLVNDLGDKMLFVSRAASFAVTATLKSMSNCIYLSKFYGDSPVFYSLKTRKYHSMDGGYNNESCYGLKESNFASWIRST